MQPQPYAPVDPYNQFQGTPVPQQGFMNNPGIATTTYPMQDPYQQQPYSGFPNQQPQGFAQYPNQQPQGFTQFPNQQPQGFTQFQSPQPQGFAQYNNMTYINQLQVIENKDDNLYSPQQPSQTSNKLYEEPVKPKPKAPARSSTFRRTWTYLGDVQNPGRGYNLLALCSIIVILGIVIGLMAYHFGSKDLKLTSVSGGLQNIVNNLNTDPILELTTAGSVLYCPTGTQAIHLGKWGGTGNGCDCIVGGLQSGSCSKDEWACNDIDAIDPIDMYVWEGSVVCAKRAQLGVDYVKASVCPSGFRSCSTGICVENSINCPVTSITITTGGINPNLKFSTTSKYLSYSSVTGDLPVIDLEISINNIPCFSSTEIPSGAGSYTLLNDSPSGCLKYGVDRTYSFEMDRLTNENVFIANNFPANVYSLPGYRRILQNTPSILSRRTRIDVANIDSCLSLNTDLIIQASKASENMNKYMTGTAIAAMVVHGCIFVFTLINILVMKSTRSWKEIFTGIDAKKWMPIYIYFGAADVIIFIVMLALVQTAHSDMSKAKNYLSELDEMGCFPTGAPKQVVADYDDLVNSVAGTLSGFSIALFVVSLVSYLPVCVKLISKWHEEKRKNKTFAY